MNICVIIIVVFFILLKWNQFEVQGQVLKTLIMDQEQATISATSSSKICVKTGISSVSQFSRSVVSDSLQPHESQHARPPCPSPTPGVHSDSCPSSQGCHPTISSSVVPSPPAPNPSKHHSLFQRVNISHEVAKVLEFELQHHSFQRNPRADLLQNGLVGSPCSLRDS